MNTYIKEKNRIIRYYQQQPVAANPDWEYLFAFFSANVFHCIPQIPLRRHEQLFKKTLINQHLSAIDQHYFHKLPVRPDVRAQRILESLADRPAIICTFHTGSYRLINYLLATAGIRFSLLLAPTVQATLGQGFLDALNGAAGDRTGFELLDAGKPTAALHMLRALKRGNSVLAYIDGNTGTADGQDHANLACIDFLESHLMVRKGLAWLAQRSGIPLHTLFCLRRPHHVLTLQAGHSFLPETNRQDAGFAASATAALYRDLAGAIRSEPWQWENWLYLHQHLLPDHHRNDRFSRFSLKNKPFLLDKFSYTVYPVPAP